MNTPIFVRVSDKEDTETYINLALVHTITLQKDGSIHAVLTTGKEATLTDPESIRLIHGFLSGKAKG